MRSVLLFTFLLASLSSHAEWVFYSQNIKGWKYWYDKSRVSIVDDIAVAWVRNKFGDSTEGDYKSSQARVKINCQSQSYLFLSQTDFSDNSWVGVIWHSNEPTKAKLIPPHTAIHDLAQIVCRKPSLII